MTTRGTTAVRLDDGTFLSPSDVYERFGRVKFALGVHEKIW